MGADDAGVPGVGAPCGGQAAEAQDRRAGRIVAAIYNTNRAQGRGCLSEDDFIPKRAPVPTLREKRATWDDINAAFGMIGRR